MKEKTKTFFKKPCRRCEKIFRPISKFNYICDDCSVKYKKKIIIKIPFKTPTINHLYGQRRTGFGQTRYLKKEAVELREKIEKICQLKNPLKLKNKKLKLIVEIYEDWNTKKGEIKKKDISNREKFLVDSVFLGLGLDDKFVFEHTMKKIQSDKEEAIINIQEIK